MSQAGQRVFDNSTVIKIKKKAFFKFVQFVLHMFVILPGLCYANVIAQGNKANQN